MNIDGLRTLVAACFSAYLAALRRDSRRYGLAVIDVSPPHLDTRFTERALFGQAPELPPPLDVSAVVAWDLKARELVTA